MSEPCLPATHPSFAPFHAAFRSQNSHPQKVKNQAKSNRNSATDSKITKHVTPLHHDPMVINFGRLRRPNPSGRTTL